MAVLLLAGMADGDLAFDATARTVTAVRDLGEVTCLVAGVSVTEAAHRAACIDGVAGVLVAEDVSLGHRPAELMADLIVSLAQGYTHIVSPVTSDARNIMPRVAALLDVMVIPDVLKVIDSKEFVRPVYAGSAVQTVRSGDTTMVVTVRTGGFAAAGEQSEAARIRSVDIPADSGLSEWIGDQMASTDRPELTSASVVVSGGRGVGSEEGFGLIVGLADALGAAVGASRAAVDSGYAPNDWQVGQTGKVVVPELYVAVGISGAIQHMAGMREAGVVVAINSDSDAPIFETADYGLVADLFEAVPALIEALSSR